MKQTPGEEKEYLMFNRHIQGTLDDQKLPGFLMDENLFDKAVNQLRLENKLPENVYRKV